MSSFRSSGRSLKSTSHASHSSHRCAAKFVVDVVHWSQGMKIKTEMGGIYNKAKGQMGKDKFKALCSDAGLTLVKVNYCQRGIKALRDSSIREVVAPGSKASSESRAREPRMEDVEEEVRSIVNHDYLVLEINPGDSNMEKFFIVAQKGIDEGKPGIYIEHVPQKAESSWVHEDVLNHIIHCNIKIPLKKIIKVLEDGDPHYNLRNANCWDYATAAAKRLLKECTHVPGISEKEYKTLNKKHDDLEADLMKNFIVNTFELVFKKIFPGSTARSAGMGSKVASKETAYKSSMQQNDIAGAQNNVGGELNPTLLLQVIGILGVLIAVSFWGW